MTHTTTHCNALQHAAPADARCNHTATHCNALQHIAFTLQSQCNTLQSHLLFNNAHYQLSHTLTNATHHNTLQHAATRCNTLTKYGARCHKYCQTQQHAATRCDTLQHSSRNVPVLMKCG